MKQKSLINDLYKYQRAWLSIKYFNEHDINELEELRELGYITIVIAHSQFLVLEIDITDKGRNFVENDQQIQDSGQS